MTTSSAFSLPALGLLVLAAACQPAARPAAPDSAATTAAAPLATTLTGQTYGEPITAAGARPLAELPSLLGTTDSAQVKLVGTAATVCQAEGCWLTMELPSGQSMRVRFKDHSFFVPKDIAGKTVVVNGWAHRETVSVADLRHYAEDAGKSAKEIAAITQPEQQLNFQADGVLVAD